MLILQISDLHVAEGRKRAFNVADSTSFFEITVEHIRSLPQKPDCVVISGDIAVDGAMGGYAIVAEVLKRLDMPIYVLPGNHDNRENFMAALAAYCPVKPETAPYLCYTEERFPLRLVFLDGTRPNSHSGHFDPPVAAWLKKTLAKRPDAPTMLFTHHPPFLSALGVMDEAYENADEFGRIVQGVPNLRLCCGHLHRPMFTMWYGVMAMTAPPITLHIVPNFSPTGGDAFTDGTPGYLIHHLYEGQVNTHVCYVPGTFEYRGPFSFSKPPKI